jgi:hypothetical protein
MLRIRALIFAILGLFFCACGPNVALFVPPPNLGNTPPGPDAPPQSFGACPLLDPPFESAASRNGSVTVLVSPFVGTAERIDEAQSAVIARIHSFDQTQSDVEGAPPLRFRVLRLQKTVEDLATANVCAKTYEAALVVWGSVYESPVAGPESVTVLPRVDVTGSVSPTTGNITASGHAIVSVGTVVANVTAKVNFPGSRPFAVLLNATSQRRMVGTASSRLDVGSLADVVTDSTLHGPALAALPFMAAFFYLDNADYSRAAQLLSTAETSAPGAAFYQNARLLRAAALVYGGQPKQGFALLNSLIGSQLPELLQWKVHMLASVTLQLLGEHKLALRVARAAHQLVAPASDADRLSALNEAGIWLSLGRPVDALLALKAAHLWREVPCQTGASALECKHEDAQGRVIAALIASWLGDPTAASVCWKKASAAAVDLQASLSSQHKLLETVFMAFAVDTPSFLDTCGMVHLLATDANLLPDVGPLPQGSIELIVNQFSAAELPPELRVRVTCGLALAVRAGWLPPPQSLLQLSPELLTSAPSQLLRSELLLAQATALIASGAPGSALPIIEAQLPVLDVELGKDSPAALEWRNTVQAIRTGIRPQSTWRKGTVVVCE